MACCKAHNLVLRNVRNRKNPKNKMLDLECKERPRESDGAVGEVRGGAGHLQNQPGNGIGVRRVDVEEGFIQLCSTMSDVSYHLPRRM